MVEKKVRLHFPKSFLWGASISTHQAEGNNQNQWTQWELETAQVKVAQAPYRYGSLPEWGDVKAEATDPNNYVSAQAADHFVRYEHDFDIAKQLHLGAIRSGIEWSRIEPQQGEFDQKAIAHYKKYFRAMKERGITPVVTLWHTSLPTWFAQQGGFAKRRNIKHYLRYIRCVMQQLGTEFQYVITINEPTVYTAMSYHERRWPPEEGSKLQSFWVLLNLAKAHKKAYTLIKRLRPNMKVGLAHNCTYYYAGDDSIISRLVVWFCHRAGNEFFINRVKSHQDFFGLNYYLASRICGTRVHNPEGAQSDLGWDLQPEKLRPLITKLYNRYKLPIMVTENGVADKDDEYRKWWISRSIQAMDGAIKDGVPLLGYMYWSLLDNFEWAEGFWPRFGLVAINYKTQQRKVRASAQWYGRLIKTIRQL